MQSYTAPPTAQRVARRLATMLIVATLLVTPLHAITPADPGPADVLLSIDSGQNVRPISPYIYGSNSDLITERTLDRLGGNRWTGYNWETNASNAGHDYFHHSDYYLTNGQANRPPGAPIREVIDAAALNGRATLVTVPMAGYVSADAAGTVDETEIAPSSRWQEVVANKSTIYPDAPLMTDPDTSDGYVFTDEFANWVESYAPPGQPVFYSLDNEPALWGEALPAGWQSGVEGGLAPSPEGRTHPTIHPYAPTFAEMRERTIAHAGAIKDVNPNALVFGGVGYGWLEAVNLQGASDAGTAPNHPGDETGGELHYYEWLLDEMAAEEAAQGRALMDVIDLHWYPEATGGGQRIVFGGGNSPELVEARVQAPRSLWDETYEEVSWITDCCSGGPIMLLKHLQRDIDDFKPGTKIAITEYNYGGGDHISGGVAQADFLGILAREGVFAANWWDLGEGSSYVDAAFNMFLNFDGAGGTFGDMSIAAAVDDDTQSAVYASLDSDDPSRMVVVAINRTTDPLATALAVTHDRVFDHAEVYQLTADSAEPVRLADVPFDQRNALQITMPALSVTTLVLIATGLPGDFNDDGTVNAADYVVWRNGLGTAYTASDYEVWRMHFGTNAQSAARTSGWTDSATVPEPTTCVLIAFAMLIAAKRCGKKPLV
jgi:hypothetical protein